MSDGAQAKPPAAAKDPIAQAMVRRRWDKTTPEERAEFARKIANARWAKAKPKRRKRSESGTAHAKTA